jgi:uncharacterized protein YqgC (DUF456 family)
MGLFFASPRAIQPVRDALVIARQQQPASDFATAEREASVKAAEVAGQVGGVGAPKVGSFLLAGVVLIILGVLACTAEAHEWTVSTEQLWKAFQTMFGVLVGLISGEATGAASKSSDP